ncbi:MAG TPA: AGE family epimerase/isomerase [Candidatus Pelethocola excrementipullorum]|nr:AGE family epimerase/isomerase [Candidatus Pelethocola excrementipullorum]
MRDEIKIHLEQGIIPFWKTLRDNIYGGYYGFMDFDRNVDKEAVKGCILNSRITWFFSSAYELLGDESLLEEARHGYQFLKEHCLDQENGGVFWSVGYDGTPEDTTKHTYNQAFAIYALSAYYKASGEEESIRLAEEIYRIIEDRCMDEEGYLEAFDRTFRPVENDKLSENGVIADKTMNTLLHVLEAYTEFYQVTRKEEVKRRLMWILDVIAEKVYNPTLHRQEVFFDSHYRSILDLYSYGHDIEAAWLIDRSLDVIGEEKYREKIEPITKDLTRQVYETAYDGHSLSNECEKGVVDDDRVWWVQAEAIVGFLNGYQKSPDRKEYLKAAEHIWQFIKTYVIDKRSGSEWYWLVDKEGKPYEDQPIVEPWKCPYHNGRMCIEVIRRTIDAA